MRHLPRRLAALCLLAALVAVLPAAVVADRSDARGRAARLHAAMRVRVQAAASLAYYSGGRLHLRDLRHDEVARGSPELAVLTGSPPNREVFHSAGRAHPVPVERLREVARRATTDEELVSGTVRDARGDPVRLLATPLYREDGTPGGAVIAIADPGPSHGAHLRMRIALAMGAAGLFLVVTAGAYLLALRALRGTTSASSPGEGMAGQGTAAGDGERRGPPPSRTAPPPPRSRPRP